MAAITQVQILVTVLFLTTFLILFQATEEYSSEFLTDLQCSESMLFTLYTVYTVLFHTHVCFAKKRSEL